MDGTPGLSSLGVPGVPWHNQILADQLTLFQPGGTNYAHIITTGTPGFSDLLTALTKDSYRKHTHTDGFTYQVALLRHMFCETK